VGEMFWFLASLTGWSMAGLICLLVRSRANGRCIAPLNGPLAQSIPRVQMNRGNVFCVGENSSLLSVIRDVLGAIGNRLTSREDLVIVT